MSVTFYDAVNIDGLKLGPIRASKGSSACKMLNILTEDGDKLKIQSPVLRIPWDIQPRQMTPEQNVTANMALSLDTSDEDGLKFLDFLKSFDEKIKTLLRDKSSELGKKDGAIEFEFKDSFKVSKEDKYPSTFLPKIWTKVSEGGSPKNLDDVSLDIKVFDMDLNKIDNFSLKKGCPCAILVSPSYAWSSALGIGVTWTTSEAVVKPMETKECGFKMDPTFEKYKTPDNKRRRVEDSNHSGSGSSEGSEVGSEQEDEF